MTETHSVERYARPIAVLMLLSMIFGGLGESYLPGRIIVSNDAAATAQNILQHPTIFRLAFATYLVEAICDIGLAVLFYQHSIRARLVRPAAIATGLPGVARRATRPSALRWVGCSADSR